MTVGSYLSHGLCQWHFEWQSAPQAMEAVREMQLPVYTASSGLRQLLVDCLEHAAALMDEEKRSRVSRPHNSACVEQACCFRFVAAIDLLSY